MSNLPKTVTAQRMVSMEVVDVKPFQFATLPLKTTKE
jgi:hypothetical protein